MIYYRHLGRARHLSPVAAAAAAFWNAHHELLLKMGSLHLVWPKSAILAPCSRAWSPPPVLVATSRMWIYAFPATHTHTYTSTRARECGNSPLHNCMHLWPMQQPHVVLHVAASRGRGQGQMDSWVGNHAGLSQNRFPFVSRLEINYCFPAATGKFMRLNGAL